MACYSAAMLPLESWKNTAVIDARRRGVMGETAAWRRQFSGSVWQHQGPPRNRMDGYLPQFLSRKGRGGANAPDPCRA